MHHIGVLIVWSEYDMDFKKRFRDLLEIDLDCCQISCWHPEFYTEEAAKRIREAIDETGVEVTALWAGWTPAGEWNVQFGPQTLGLVPAAYREHRLAEVKAGADFAYRIGVENVVTHVGFLPETPDHPDYIGTVAALRNLCRHMAPRNQTFLFETGQETPMTMLRTIEMIGMPNVGINFDTANLILYGRGNSVDAIEVFGKYVRNLHLKDGNLPTSGMELGKEVPLGTGRANIPEVLKRLEEIGYQGPWIIEREISGEQQRKDIVAGRDLLREIEKTL